MSMSRSNMACMASCKLVSWPTFIFNSSWHSMAIHHAPSHQDSGTTKHDPLPLPWSLMTSSSTPTSRMPCISWPYYSNTTRSAKIGQPLATVASPSPGTMLTTPLIFPCLATLNVHSCTSVIHYPQEPSIPHVHGRNPSTEPC